MSFPWACLAILKRLSSCAEKSIALVDCDSSQVPDGRTVFRSPYFCLEFLPPELQGKNLSQIDRKAEHDNFALGSLIFELLCNGHHPFATQYLGAGNTPSLGERIKGGWWPHATKRDKTVPVNRASAVLTGDPSVSM